MFRSGNAAAWGCLGTARTCFECNGRRWQGAKLRQRSVHHGSALMCRPFDHLFWRSKPSWSKIWAGEFSEFSELSCFPDARFEQPRQRNWNYRCLNDTRWQVMNGDHLESLVEHSSRWITATPPERHTIHVYRYIPDMEDAMLRAWFGSLWNLSKSGPDTQFPMVWWLLAILHRGGRFMMVTSGCLNSRFSSSHVFNSRSGAGGASEFRQKSRISKNPGFWAGWWSHMVAKNVQSHFEKLSRNQLRLFCAFFFAFFDDPSQGTMTENYQRDHDLDWLDPMNDDDNAQNRFSMTLYNKC